MHVNHERHIDTKIWNYELAVVVGFLFWVEGNSPQWFFRLVIANSDCGTLDTVSCAIHDTSLH